MKIWVLVAAMVMGGALPPQVMGDNAITMQWCAQAKSKKKSKKNKVKQKKKKSVSILGAPVRWQVRLVKHLPVDLIMNIWCKQQGIE